MTALNLGLAEEAGAEGVGSVERFAATRTREERRHLLTQAVWGALLSLGSLLLGIASLQLIAQGDTSLVVAGCAGFLMALFIDLVYARRLCRAVDDL